MPKTALLAMILAAAFADVSARTLSRPIAPQGGAGLFGLIPTEVDAGEGDCSVVILVQRSGGSAGVVSVDYATVAGSAVSDEDYDPRSGTVTFGDGDSADRGIQIYLVDDAVAEADETFQLVLSNPQGGVEIWHNPVTITIVDNEAGDPIFAAGFETNDVCF